MLCLDFETYYDNEYGLKSMSTWDYVHDDRFNAYLLGAYNNDVEWVGDPKDFDWSIIHGQMLLAHNAYFDGLVLRRLRELGVVPDEFQETGWLCTADMAAYLRVPRSLKGACKELIDEEIDKTVRASMKGKTYAEAETAGMLEDLLAYGIQDPKAAFILWEKFHHLWPKCEQVYSQNLRNACWRGAPVAVDRAQQAYEDLDWERLKLLKSLPWLDKYKPLSPQGLRMQGRKEGIPVPASLDKRDPDAIAWYKEYGDKVPWVGAVRDYRSINTHCNKVRTVWKGAREDGTMPFQIKYCGAHTGRTSAGGADPTGGKFNPLNMNRAALFGVDIRNLFEAPEGQTLVICDYDQIEAIMLLWRVKDFEFLKQAEQEGNVYQAYAKRNFGYVGNDLKADNKSLYERAKVSVLQLGYQSGWTKFQHIADVNYGIILTDTEAEALVTTFRTANPKIVDYWELHNSFVKYSANQSDATHEVELVSGRDLVYFKPHWEKNPFNKYRQVVAQSTKGGRSSKLYGGLLTENEIQATARDVLRDGRNAVEAAGHTVLWDVYDELICLVPENEAEDRAKEIQHLMVSSSPWAEGCPLGASYTITKFYLKD